VQGIYFFLDKGQQKCFKAEVPKDTLVQGNYNVTPVMSINGIVPQDNAVRTFAFSVTVMDPENTAFMSKNLELKGRFAFTAPDGGEHTICLSVNHNLHATQFGQETNRAKVSLELKTGVDAMDYTTVAKIEHLDQMEIQIRSLTDRVQAIRREQNYQKQREEEFRDTSELVNERVAWWSIFQILIVIITGIYQIYHLKAFFKLKKLV